MEGGGRAISADTALRPNLIGVWGFITTQAKMTVTPSAPPPPSAPLLPFLVVMYPNSRFN
jgi:hypothetical protein